MMLADHTDEQLLSAWAEKGDHAAFQVLASRYGGLVYGAALRRVGEAGLAQEIAQDVFAALATRAGRLAQHQSLAAWLHRTTMLTALDRLRRRARQARKIEELRAMNANSPAHDPWKQTAPHLDEALDRLRREDREVLMLHYAEQLSFPKIAARLGGTSDGMRMRATRALEALARALRKQGLHVSSAVLAAGLGGALTQTAPASLTLAPLVAAGAAKISPVTYFIHTLHTMKLTQLAAAGLALLLAVTAVVQQTQIARAEARVADLGRAAVEGDSPTELEGAKRSGVSAAAGIGARNVVTGFDLAQMSRVALDRDLLELRRLQKALARLDANNLGGLVETVMKSGLMRHPREELVSVLLDELAKKSPELCLRWSFEAMAQTQGREYFDKLSERTRAALRAWVAKDADAALQWALEKGPEWAALRARMPLARNSYISYNSGDPSKNVRLPAREEEEMESLRGLVASELLGREPGKAVALMQTMTSGGATTVLENARDLGAEQLKALATTFAADPDADRRRAVIFRIGWRLGGTAGDGRNLQPMGEMLRALPLADTDRGYLAVRMGMDSLPFKQRGDEVLIEGVRNWLGTMVTPRELPYFEGTLSHVYSPGAALRHLNAKLDALPDDELIAGYVEAVDRKQYINAAVISGKKDGIRGETAFRLATRVEKPERRQALLAVAWEDLLHDAPKNARAILEIPELQAADRAALEARFANQLK